MVLRSSVMMTVICTVHAGVESDKENIQIRCHMVMDVGVAGS